MAQGQLVLAAVTLASSIAGGLFVLLTQLLIRGKVRAEADKLKAEAEKVKAETKKLHAEIAQLATVVISTPPSASERSLPEHWSASGSAPDDYEMGSEERSDESIGFIRSRCATREFGTLMQSFIADQYRGSRLRFTAEVAVSRVTISAGIWLRIDGHRKEVLGFDNMQDRRLGGTRDWTKVEVVLDVPDDAAKVAFGILLHGEGQIQFRKLMFEQVPDSIPTTGQLVALPPLRREPLNLQLRMNPR